MVYMYVCICIYIERVYSIIKKNEITSFAGKRRSCWVRQDELKKPIIECFYSFVESTLDLGQKAKAWSSFVESKPKMMRMIIMGHECKRGTI
jgi:hypothetical protein